MKKPLAKNCELRNYQNMAKQTLQEFLEPHGEKARLADALKIDRGSLTKWLRKRVPAERVLDVERHTGIPRTAIRPDLYPPHLNPAPHAPADQAGQI